MLILNIKSVIFDPMSTNQRSIPITLCKIREDTKIENLVFLPKKRRKKGIFFATIIHTIITNTVRKK